MAEIVIELRENGSIKIPGPLVYVDELGNEHILEQERISLCRCGASKDQPFCDKTHRSIGFEAPGGTLRLKQDTQRG
jgi:CDGSH-type Zn-finger protein